MSTPFGTRLKRLRKQQKMTQAELAAVAGVSQATIARWEAGEQTPIMLVQEALTARVRGMRDGR